MTVRDTLCFCDSAISVIQGKDPILALSQARHSLAPMHSALGPLTLGLVPHSLASSPISSHGPSS